MNTLIDLTSKIPKEVSQVTETLEKAGYEAYLVGGCVRDLLLENPPADGPKDWDITTNAKPEEIISLFQKTIYENNFGTVGVCIPLDVSYETQKEDVNSVDAEVIANKHKKLNDNVSRETLEESVNRGTLEKDVNRETLEESVSRETFIDNVSRLSTKALASVGITSDGVEYQVIEVTPYRIETKYSDFRHPDEVKFGNSLEDDLKRRDFTINAIAYNSKGHFLSDIFEGLKDIKDKVLRTVGNPHDRFEEDPLRMLRAIRLALQLDFSIAQETADSILKNADLIKKISMERTKDEFIKIIMSKNPSAGIVLLQKFGLLKNIIPELEEGIGCEQLGEHIYDVWDHLLHALQHSANKNWPLEIRLSALFHDIGKSRTRRTGEKKAYTFYGHEVVGARMTKKIMERLKFSKKEIELVEKLVRNHMFFSDTEKITLSAVRRIIAKMEFSTNCVRQDLTQFEVHPIWILMKIRECDRVGMKKKEAPYRLRKYFAMIEEALHDPISVSQLKINGEDLIKEGIKPSPRMGFILNALLEEVLDDPTKNNKEHLLELAKSLDMLEDHPLKILGERGKEKKEQLEEEEILKLHKKHSVL